VRVTIVLDVTPEQRLAIGRRALGQVKAASEEGVRYWAERVLRDALRDLTDGEVLEGGSARSVQEYCPGDDQGLDASKEPADKDEEPAG
jgi:hypothetical protein